MNTEADGGYCLICYQCIYFQHYHLNYLIGYLENKIKFIFLITFSIDENILSHQRVHKLYHQIEDQRKKF